jgi:DNA-binding CsgD family transcriptional regulator
MGPNDSPHGSLLVGRDREFRALHESLAAALGGRGRLVLMSGEAGVGKTALAEALCAEAASRGALTLIGRCYDLTETPPYDPWIQVGSRIPRSPDMPPFPDALRTAMHTPRQFFAEVRDFFAAAAAPRPEGARPLVLLFDDLQWADRASLDLLRFLSRSLPPLPILVLAVYRPDDLTRDHPLYPLLPLLVRESHAVRLDLAPLTRAAVSELVRTRYRLTTFDTARLVAYLSQRTDGNALFVTELLHALEERGMLAAESAALDDIGTLGVPPLLRQVVEGRVARLGTEAERLLGIAAVIGQEAPLDTWASIGAVDESTVEQVAERALGARLLREVPGGERFAFAHALIREALYESIPGSRRRRLHLRIGEILASGAAPAPDMVAYHFRQAGDPRMADWMIQAGWLAYRSMAYHMARARFVEVRARVEGVERVRVLLALAFLDRYRERGVPYANEALAAARAIGDETLIGLAQFRAGANLGYQSQVRAGLAAMAAADETLDCLPDAAFSAFRPLPGLSLSQEERKSHRAWLLAYSGQWREALALLGTTTETLEERIAGLDAQGRYALWFVCAWLCRPESMRRVIAEMIASSEAREEDLAVLATQVAAGYSLVLPFFADDPEVRRRYEEGLARTTRRVEEALGAVPPLLTRCPLLVVSGRWEEAEALWERREKALVNSGDAVMNLPYIGMMLAARGKYAAAWALVREGLPDGPRTAPGATHFNATVRLLPVAARLALREGDHEQARHWLEAQDRLFTWAGPEVRWGRSDAHLAWAEYHRALDEAGIALRYADQALADASEPRQPLALLAAHRVHGILLTETRRYVEAGHHLCQARALADACMAPYEQALTAIAFAELYVATGKPEEARRYLNRGRALCQQLGAHSKDARIAAITAKLAAAPFPASDRPAGLTAREAEVLRLVAQGWTARQVATHLSLSPRTVNQHLRSVYNKLGVSTRAAATRFAVAHDIV